MNRAISGVVRRGDLSARERDALVAEHVMGEASPPYTHGYAGLTAAIQQQAKFSEGGNWFEHFDYERGDVGVWVPKAFSTSIAATWDAVEKLTTNGHPVLVESRAPDEGCPTYLCEVWGKRAGLPVSEWDGEADTAPEAIAIAALRACGVEVVTDG